MIKKLFVVTIVIGFFLSFSNNVFAQSAVSKCVVVKVGNPDPNITPVFPPSCLTQSNGNEGGATSGQGGNVLSWTEQIANRLEIRPLDNRSYSRMMANISNGKYSAVKRQGLDRGVGPTGLYWCTNIVIDSYNLSGITGLGPQHQGVINMNSWWKNKTDYVYLNYKQNPQDALSKLKPGYAFFLIGRAGEHTGVVKNVSIDSRGNGYYETYESNSKKIYHKYVVSGWSVSAWTTLVGFGGHL